jgi:homocysteine S-methyltransferase
MDQNKIMVIDGSMGTGLEHLGCNLNDSLWTAKVLAEQPELVKKVHYDYFRAGADCGITCSYQATIPGLMAKGYTQEEAEKLIARSVEVFCEARDEWWEKEGKASGRPYPLCLAGMGPYGAYLADGSEYSGSYRVSDEVLADFHKRRMQILWEAGADLLLFETQPSFKEVLIETSLAEELGADYWVSFSCADGKHTCGGDLLVNCAKELSENHPHLKMIGVNCTAPQHIESLIHELQKGTDLPIAVYPNSGEVYDPETKTWSGQPNALPFGEYAKRYMLAGASAVGGCCTTVNSHIEAVAAAREEVLQNKIPVRIHK